jgi:hypothetical protein
MTGCAQAVKPAGLMVPVPERERRLEFDLTADSAFHPTSNADVIAQAIAQSICLLRTERPDECRAPEEDPPVCSVRAESEIRASIEPAFRALRDVRLTSPFRIQSEVQNAIPGALATVAVFDARREASCRQWQSADGSCVAARVDKLWVLLRAPWGGHKLSPRRGSGHVGARPNTR